MSSARPLRLGGRLQEIAEQLRRPYIEFVAGLGRQQSDETMWWASAFASKSPLQTDFFLLVCYVALVLRLVDEWKEQDRPLLVFVDDPWVLSDLRTALRGRSDARVVGPAPTWPAAAVWLARGVAARLHLILSLVAEWMAAASFFRGGHGRPPGDELAVGIVSVAEPRSVSGDGFHDPYLGRLGALLQSSGIRVIRPILPFFPLRLTWALARFKEEVWPLILELRPQDLVHGLRAWRPRLPGRMAIGRYPVDSLVRREVLVALRNSVFNGNLVVKALMKRFFARGWIETIVYAFENQPWEKMMCMAAREAGQLRLIGHQHSTVPRFLLTHFLGEGEGAVVPLPDRVLTSGPLTTDLLRCEGGYPPGCVIEAGSLRYEHIRQMMHLAQSPRRSRIVLIVLPVDVPRARFMLAQAAKAFEDPGDSWRLVVKRHPDIAGMILPMSPRLRQVAEFSDAPFSDLLQDAEIVVASGSAVVEAWLCSRTVIRVRYENRLDLDPGGENEPGILVADEDDLARVIVDCMRAAEQRPHPVTADRENVYFGPVRPDVWLREVGATPKAEQRHSAEAGSGVSVHGEPR